MALSITKELESTLGLAFAEAKARRHEHVTLEHLLYALLRDPVAARILRACGRADDEQAGDHHHVEHKTENHYRSEHDRAANHWRNDEHQDGPQDPNRFDHSSPQD